MTTPLLDTVQLLLRRPISPARDLLSGRHFDAAIAWIERASTMGNGGISKGYDLLRRKWSPAYPETTGYSIPSLLNTAEARSIPGLQDLALKLADYLLTCSTPEGGVVHWQSNPNAKPVVFDTGQVIFGWLAAYEFSQNPLYLQAAQRAGDWLVSVQDPTGAWVQFQHLGVVKVIDTRVAWALLELEKRQPKGSFRTAAIRNLDWALTRQHPDGWFADCAFRPEEDPFTHTLVYTAEGFQECGLLLGEKRYLDAALRTSSALLSVQSQNGSLASTYRAGWQASSRSSCLTGNCQAARLWMQHFGALGEEKSLDGAVRALQFVAGTQVMPPGNADIAGAIAGSFPLTGRYERMKYPNWAAKFFIDALLTLEKIEKVSSSLLTYKG